MEQIYSEETLLKFNQIFIKYLKLDMNDFYSENIKEYEEHHIFNNILISLINTLNIDLNNLDSNESNKTLNNISTFFNYIKTNKISSFLYLFTMQNTEDVYYAAHFNDVLFKTLVSGSDIFLYIEYIESLSVKFEIKLETMLDNNDPILIEILKPLILNNIDLYLRISDWTTLESDGNIFKGETIKDIDIIDGKLYIDGYDYTTINVVSYNEDESIKYKKNLSSYYNLDLTLIDIIVNRLSKKIKKFKENLIKKFFIETNTTLSKNNFIFNNFADLTDELNKGVKTEGIAFKITKENLVKFLIDYLPKTNYNTYPSFKELYEEDFKNFKKFVNSYKFTEDDIYNIVKS